MSGTDRRKVWTQVIMVVGAVALGVIGIFTVTNTVGGSSNNCVGGVCGDGNKNNTVGTVAPSPAR
ncbi:hypothetical protein AB0N23_07505 [Streptomyces sp. NPDC052644]